MIALILAAGQGTRLRPITENAPKAMTYLFGKALIDYQIEIFKILGFSKIIIVGGYMSNKLPAGGVSVIVNNNFETTNMVYSLFCAKNILLQSKEDVVVSYGDIVFEKQVLEKLINSDNDYSVVSDQGWETLWRNRMEHYLNDVETFSTDSDDYIVSLGKRPKSLNEVGGQFIGLLKIKKNKLQEFFSIKEKITSNKEFNSLFMTDYIQEMINLGVKVKSIYIKNGWLEVDTVQDLNSYIHLKEIGKLHEIWDPTN